VTAPARIAAVVVAGLLTAATVLGSALPWTVEPEDTALVRLSWRAVGQRVDECRKPTAEELAALPPHMRQQEICEARLTPFLLAVSIDGASAFEGRILPSGARQDRPTYVLQEFPVAPGEHRVEVSFVQDLPRDAATPEHLAETVTLAPREVLLVTRDETTGLSILERSLD
jgi:hypothetical protein